MGRTIIQHRWATPEIIAQFNPENIKFGKDWLTHLSATDHSNSTIKSYRWNLNVIWQWNLTYNNNKLFVSWDKPDIIAFQAWCMDECMHSPARVRHLKSTIASMSNYVENMLDRQYPEFRKATQKIPSPVNRPVLTKSVFKMHDINVLLGHLTFTCQFEKACCLALAVCSGRRKAELLRFKLSDFTEDRLVCDGALYKSSPIKTKGRGRDGKKLECFVLAKQFKPYLDRWLAYRERHGIVSDWLFPSPIDPTVAISESSLDDWTKQFSEMLPEPFYWHSMRHLICTAFKKAGIPDSVIKEYIGWEHIDMVATYTDLEAEEQLAMYFNADGTYGGVDGKITDIK